MINLFQRKKDPKDNYATHRKQDSKTFANNNNTPNPNLKTENTEEKDYIYDSIKTEPRDKGD